MLSIIFFTVRDLSDTYIIFIPVSEELPPTTSPVTLPTYQTGSSHPTYQTGSSHTIHRQCIYTYNKYFFKVASGNLTCGFVGLIGANPVTITSPNYPSNYPTNTTCSWTLMAPDGQNVQLNLEVLDLETCCDFVQVVFVIQCKIIIYILSLQAHVLVGLSNLYKS